MSNTKILVSTRYNEYFEVSGELLVQLLAAPVYHQDYNDGYKYKLSTESLDMQLCTEKDFLEESSVTLNIESIMEENNRLTRELELLKAKLPKDPSTSKEILIADVLFSRY